jgi:hypothetical protein
MAITGINLTNLQLWQIFCGAFSAAIILWWLRNILLKRALRRLCGVPLSGYRLLGTNLIWPKRPIMLKKDSLYGIPSTVFLKNDGKTAYVCQYNPRLFNGRVKVRERYQVLLLMGLTMEKLKPGVIQGAIRYQDHLELIKYEPDIYKQLLGLQDEYREAIHEWAPPNVRPLFNRDQKI